MSNIFLVLSITVPIGYHDETGITTQLASLTFWPNNELSSGNFRQCIAGLIDVSLTLGLIQIKLTFSLFASNSNKKNVKNISSSWDSAHSKHQL